jgi:protease I
MTTTTGRGAVLIPVAADYEDLEVWYPKLRLEEAGHTVVVAGLGEREVRGKHGYPCPVEAHLRDCSAARFAAIVIPGGWAPDKLRRDPHLCGVVRELVEEGKPVAAICHGPWVLISAGVVRGRKVTSSIGIRDDLTNAGAHWVDEPVVVDGNIITGRVPKDLPAFGLALVRALS